MGSIEMSSTSSICRKVENFPPLGISSVTSIDTSRVGRSASTKDASKIYIRRRLLRVVTVSLFLASTALRLKFCDASPARNSHPTVSAQRRRPRGTLTWFENRELDESEAGDGEDSTEDQDDTSELTGETDDTSESEEEETEDDYYKFDEGPPPPRLLPLSVYDVVGFLLASMGVTLAAGGGIGGGGILVPIYILIFEFPPRAAIPLSAITVMGGAAAATLHNARRRHPLADRPITDWDLILVMEPLILVGAMVGTLFHIALSEKVLVVMLVVFLSVMAHTTLTRARKMYRAENQYLDRLKHLRREQEARRQEVEHRQQEASTKKKKKKEILPHTLLPEDEKGPSLLPNSWRRVSSQAESTSEPNNEEILIMNPDYVSSLRSDLLEQEKVTSGSKIMSICGVFFVYVFLEIMIGGGSLDSPWGIRCGGPAFWSVHAILIASLIASAFAAQTYLVNRHEIKELVEFDFVHGDVRWDSRTSIVYPFMFGFAGLFAGMFGIGGGMVTVPLFFTMGVHPMVATATSSTMTLFTSFAASVSFAIFGLYLWDYALVCMCVGFFASFFGQKIMRRAHKAGNHGNFERTSMIAFSIGGLILLSAFLMTLQYLYQIFAGYEEGDSGGLCEGYRYHRVSS